MTEQTAPTPTRVAERALALAESPRLDHLLAIAEVFAALAAHAATRERTGRVDTRNFISSSRPGVRLGAPRRRPRSS
jgi:hypothetical protein